MWHSRSAGTKWAIVVTGAAAILATTIDVQAAGGEERIRWRFEIPSIGSGRHIAVGADGVIYTTQFDPAILYAVGKDGSLLWSIDLVGAFATDWPITIADEGTIYAGAARNVTAVNPDGTLKWSFDAGKLLIAGPTVGPEGNIYAACNGIDEGDLGFFALDPDGNLRWSTPGDPPIFGLYSRLDNIVFGEDRLFAGINFPRSGRWVITYALDFDGRQLWTRAYVGLEGGPSSNPRMLPDGRLIYREGQGRLMAINQDGTNDWIVPHPGGAQVLVTPVVGSDGSIYAGDIHGVQLWSTDSEGNTRWFHEGNIDEHLDRSLGVSPDNQVLLAGGVTWSQTDGVNYGWIRGHDAASGELLWQIDLELEQGLTQIVRSYQPEFSRDGATAYLTTWFVSDGVGHTYLYALALKDVVGDLDGSGVVGILDLLELLANWGRCPRGNTPCPADFDGSRAVDIADLLILLGNWG